MANDKTTRGAKAPKVTLTGKEIELVSNLLRQFHIGLGDEGRLPPAWQHELKDRLDLARGVGLGARPWVAAS